MLTKLLSDLYPDKTFIKNVDKYSNALRLDDEKSTWIPDKIRVAKAVCTHWKSGLNYLDLYKQINALATLIEAANGLGDSTQEHPEKTEPRFEWD